MCNPARHLTWSAYPTLISTSRSKQKTFQQSVRNDEDNVSVTSSQYYKFYFKTFKC